MFADKVKNLLHSFENPVVVDPEKFQDPLAEKVSWQGSGKNNPSSTSTVLYEREPGVLSYKPSMTGWIFSLIFMLTGLLSVVVYFFVPVTGNAPKWVLLLVGVLFMAAGVFIFFQSSRIIAFDENLGLFYRGKKARSSREIQGHLTAVPFSDIHALQLLLRMSRVKSTDNRPDRFVPVYELNLVKADGERVHVITYSRREKAREDAYTLSDRLHVPVWDGIDG